MPFLYFNVKLIYSPFISKGVSTNVDALSALRHHGIRFVFYHCLLSVVEN